MKLLLSHLLLLLLLPLVAQPDPSFAAAEAAARAGRVIEVQGVAAVRSPMSARWTPASTQLALQVGDLLRTEGRGAHAVHLQLNNNARLILGPGAQVELAGPENFRLSPHPAGPVR